MLYSEIDRMSTESSRWLEWLVGWFMVFNATFNNISIISSLEWNDI